MEGHTQKQQRVAESKESVGERMLLFVLHLAPDNDGGLVKKAFESVANEPFNLKHHVTYIRPAF